MEMEPTTNHENEDARNGDAVSRENEVINTPRTNLIIAPATEICRALRADLMIVESDAMAYREAATTNMSYVAADNLVGVLDRALLRLDVLVPIVDRLASDQDHREIFRQNADPGMDISNMGIGELVQLQRKLSARLWKLKLEDENTQRVTLPEPSIRDPLSRTEKQTSGP